MKYRQTLMLTGATLLAVAPKCPLCFLFYIGVFGVAATSASAYRTWLPLVTALWLALTVGMLAVQRAESHRSGPFAIGLYAAAAVFAGKFIFNLDVLVYGGIVALVGAVIWSSWLRKPNSTPPCTACE